MNGTFGTVSGNEAGRVPLKTSCASRSKPPVVTPRRRGGSTQHVMAAPVRFTLSRVLARHDVFDSEHGLPDRSVARPAYLAHATARPGEKAVRDLRGNPSTVHLAGCEACYSVRSGEWEFF
jgi:hypothetical protein